MRAGGPNKHRWEVLMDSSGVGDWHGARGTGPPTHVSIHRAHVRGHRAEGTGHRAHGGGGTDDPGCHVL